MADAQTYRPAWDYTNMLELPFGLTAARVPAVENFVRGPAATRFAEVAARAGQAGYAGADKAAAAFAHRGAATTREAYSVMRDMRRYIRTNPPPAPAAPAAPSTAARAATSATRAAGEGTADFVARKTAEAASQHGIRSVGSAVKTAAQKTTDFLIGAPGQRLATAGRTGLWAFGIHGAIEGSKGIYELGSALTLEENRAMIGGRSAWYDYVNPIPVKGGVNPDEVQHNLANSFKRLAAGVFTLGIADWGTSEYDPESDPGSYAAQAIRAQRAAQKMRDDFYRSRLDDVKSLSTYEKGSDVLAFVQRAAEGASRYEQWADRREKQLAPFPKKIRTDRGWSYDRQMSDSEMYARQLIHQNRQFAASVRRDAMQSVRDAFKDSPDEYRKLLADRVDSVIIPATYPDRFKNGVTFDPQRLYTDADFGKKVLKYREQLLSNPDLEMDILTYSGEGAK